MTPDPLNRLVAQLAKLPGIGEKTAQRLAFHILRAPGEYAAELSQAIREVKEKVHLCVRCFSLTDAETCNFCRDARRDERVLCVVETFADLMALERTREFKGRYHVLHGVLSPLEGVGPEQLRIRELLERLNDSRVEELILATNPDIEGEATALYLTRLLKPMGLRVTRIAQGLPMGGDLEFADQATLAKALSARRDL
ncbi:MULTISPECIES: recombination mediator RecR [Myxococcus]|uniref:Recombination protein RecR n=1 Tax=Myxococcus xanthus TaxID=34 RepID=A0AAE6FXU5_MYXXA|nr:MULTISPECIES: recombination mediator RecR [Myxococcus]QDE67157.1 recombination protein RecR [Myxococcus xanthus]QDE74432.1 recombination protein RecR [Myxococcus xanthus]QDE81719.1 recombination protein RecR [Myxococcus xanthus]QDE96018.1 recombination protein RecR [Myxococcus xanthus]QDF03460.1 recombination protein RecR [Myxococcus xanthus]